MPIKTIDLHERASDHPEALSTYTASPIRYRVLLWPHRSLPPKGFVLFIAITSAMISLPLFPLLGTAALWGLLPFLVLTIALLWFFIMRSYRDADLVEELSIWDDHMELVRLNPDASRQEWHANPYWVEVTQHDTPVENYLTLRGGLREVELGAFLSPDERLTLKTTLQAELHRLAQPD